MTCAVVPVAAADAVDGRIVALVALPLMPEFETTIPLTMVIGWREGAIPATDASVSPPGMLGTRGCCGTMDDDDKLVVTMSLDDVTMVATASVVGTATSEDGTADNDVSIIEAEGLIVAKIEEVLERSADALVLS